METTISKTKVFGTYAINFNTVDSDTIKIDNHICFDGEVKQNHYYRLQNSLISEKYNKIYQACGLNYENSKNESLAGRKNSNDLQGKILSDP